MTPYEMLSIGCGDGGIPASLVEKEFALAIAMNEYGWWIPTKTPQ